MAFRGHFRRPQILGFHPYSPGRSIAEVKARFRLKKVIKIASNENAWGPSPGAVAAARRAAGEISRYPEGPSPGLRAALARRHRVHPSQIVVGAGSDEIIELLGKAFLRPQDDIVVSRHAFIRYRMAGELMGATVHTVPMRYFKHDLSAMREAVTRSTKLVFIANPNNPTGTYNTVREVRQFLSGLRGDVLAVFDEAYFEYASLEPDYGSILENRLGGGRTVVLRTFSKVYGLAGLRVGYAIAPSWIVRTLDRIRAPFNVSNVGQAAALAALKDQAHIRRSVRANRIGKEFLTGELHRLGVGFIPSCANFVLVNLSPRNGGEVFERLLSRGIIVRPVDEYGFPHHIRVTVGTPSENRAFIRAFKEVLMMRGDSS